ncbi:two-component sensor histidine kinase, partial [Mycobacterium tuberculosis]|nr:two-component sensor histidine kinase [Mycobacterium tuberculosis]
FLARADAATAKLDRVSVDLGAELSKIAEYFTVLSEDKGVTITVAASGWVNSDLMMFRRAIGNLLSNAIRHAELGSTVIVSSELK